MKQCAEEGNLDNSHRYFATELTSEKLLQVFACPAFAFFLFTARRQLLFLFLLDALLQLEKAANIFAQAIEDELGFGFAAFGITVFIIERAVRATVQPRRTVFTYRIGRHRAVHTLSNSLSTFVTGCHNYFSGFKNSGRVKRKWLTFGNGQEA
jgi:hypothetical protein